MTEKMFVGTAAAAAAVDRSAAWVLRQLRDGLVPDARLNPGKGAPALFGLFHFYPLVLLAEVSKAKSLTRQKFEENTGAFLAAVERFLDDPADEDRHVYITYLGEAGYFEAVDLESLHRKVQAAYSYACHVQENMTNTRAPLQRPAVYATV